MTTEQTTTKKKPKKIGRPRKIETPTEFDRLVDKYVEECEAEKEPITWTGMCLALGFTSREAVDTYANYEGFSDSVKRAKTLVENAYEKRLHGHNAAGAIFALKNMGWRDRQDLDVTSREESDPVATLNKAHQRAREGREQWEEQRNGNSDNRKPESGPVH